MPAPRQRVFLGWDAPPLQAAADWILAELGGDLVDWTVALPGQRAGRQLAQHLAQRAPAEWTPPRIVTQGQLIDALVQLERPVAGRLVRTLAWERALREVPALELEHLARHLGSELGLRDRMRLAETVRGLYGELAPEGLSFEDLAGGRAEAEGGARAPRWHALALVQRRYRKILDEVGLLDPNAGRLTAIEFGRVDPTRRVVLVGIADMNHLLARLLETIHARCDVLVVAPASMARGFDAWGRLSTAFWRDRNLPLANEHWHTVEKPVDQADCLARVVASWEGRFAPHELTIGLGDEQVAPYLERRLAAGGVRLTNAAGRPIEHTRPYRLLRAVARYLERGAFADRAAQVRDPDLGRDLLERADHVHALDRYQGRHLPVMADQELAEDPDCKPAVEAMRRRLHERLGELRAREPRPLSEWASRLRAFLAGTYGQRELDLADAADRVLAQALAGLGQALGEMESAPGPLGAATHPASDAIEILLRRARGTRLPDRVAEGAAATVELLGWLELPLDEAPALIVTGFNEGRIPASVHGHPFLPDGARKRLGLPHDEDRVARDVYACTVLLSTRREAVFISGRRTLEGDPLAPSRLAFHVPEREIAARVRCFLPDEEARIEAAVISEGTGRAVLRPVLAPDGPRDAPESMSVSSFRDYLQSPYGYYLRHVLRLDTLDDRARELDPRLFGILAHQVLQAFGESDLAHSAEAEPIARFLADEVERELAARCGPAPQPAVRLQAEQLKYRLGLFATRQAERRRRGWRIEHVEWQPPEGSVDFEVDGTPVAIRGQIDRIDLHPERGWAIIDYKTGEQTRAPEDAHRHMGHWIDLQLPLYRLLARPLGMESAPRLGYGTLGKDEKHVAFAFADNWNEADLEAAYERARDVVRAVRRGEFEGPDLRTPYEPILRALHGVGLIADESGAGEAE